MYNKLYISYFSETGESIIKRYKMGEVTITASDHVSFGINKGEFAVVVGSSGAGKTTILNQRTDEEI